MSMWDELDIASMSFSLAFIIVLLILSLLAVKFLAPNLSKIDKWIFVWYCFDALIHLILEASFAWISVFGTVATNNTHPLAETWKEYGKADTRWLHSDSCIVSVELITVLLDGPLCLYLIYAMIKNKRDRHFWQIVLSVAEIYGGWMTFCPEWLTGSESLRTDNPMYNILYLWFFNGLWVIIPVLLLIQSYRAMIPQKSKNE
eukprot:gb/GECH01006724.1/.p1 GENE.gb/GECH01006724.1/~~gb/GECH01006724.1/.p1  ORF type:complete len:202 (+),score=39.46 gb/GECH01006724.1/:1-606(+)